MLVRTPNYVSVAVSAVCEPGAEVGDFVDVLIEKQDGTIYTEREEILEIITN